MNALRRSCPLVLVLLCVVLGTARWASAQLNNLRTNVLTISPGNPLEIYAGTENGIYKSLNAGASWRDISAGLPTTRFVQNLLIDRLRPQTIYAMVVGQAGVGGVFKSVDGGETWAAADSGLQLTDDMRLAMDPANPSILYTAGRAGGRSSNVGLYYKTTNGGASWTFLHFGGLAPITSLEVDPFSATTLYSVALGVVFKSTDGGATWSSSNSGVNAGRRLFTDPSIAGTLYVQGDSAIFKSTNSAAGWKTVYQGSQLRTLAIAPTDSARVYAGGVGSIVRSADAGMTWLASANFPPDRTVWGVTVDPNFPGIVYAGTDAGVYKTLDGGITWQLGGATIDVPPILSGLSSGSAAQDSIVPIMLTGTGFVAPLTITAGDDIVVSNINSSSTTAAAATLRISPAAALGPRSIRIVTAGGPSNTLPFAITPAVPVAPTLSGVSPASATRGARFMATITGTGFTPSMSVDGGNEIAVTNLQVLDSTTATALFSVSASAARGSHEVRLKTSGGISGSFAITVRIPQYSDFNGDGKTDLLLRSAATGRTSEWLMDGTGITSQQLLLTHVQWRPAAIADFNGDGSADLLWYNPVTDETVLWLMNGTNILSWASLLANSEWRVLATGDFNGDGKADLVWKNSATMNISIWLMEGLTILHWVQLGIVSNMEISAVADLNGDGKDDLVWYDATKVETVAWTMEGTRVGQFETLIGASDWRVIHTGDLNGDGKADLLWHSYSLQETVAWLMDGVNLLEWKSLLTDANRHIAAVVDFNGDGKEDLLWYDATSGQTSNWLMNGTAVLSQNILLTDPYWRVTGTGDFNGDGRVDLFWQYSLTGESAVWLMNGATASSYGSVATGVVDLPFH